MKRIFATALPNTSLPQQTTLTPVPVNNNPQAAVVTGTSSTSGLSLPNTAVTVTPAHSAHHSAVVQPSNSPQQQQQQPQPLQIPIGLMASVSKAAMASAAAANIESNPSSNSSVTVSLTSSKPNLVGLGGPQQHPVPMVLEDREEVIPFSQAPSVIVTPAPLNSNGGIVKLPAVSNNLTIVDNGKVEVTPIKETEPVLQLSQAKKAKFD